jgi:hypothetical protein
MTWKTATKTLDARFQMRETLLLRVSDTRKAGKKSQIQSSSAKGRKTHSDFIYKSKKNSKSDIPLQATEDNRTSEADEPGALGFQSESNDSSCV